MKNKNNFAYCKECKSKLIDLSTINVKGTMEIDCDTCGITNRIKTR